MIQANCSSHRVRWDSYLALLSRSVTLRIAQIISLNRATKTSNEKQRDVRG